ncbi:hypothetical protein ATANTOWER_010702 [Ataeniobius toweri]|uniref:Uncharacterized protein n=1 Tax=Ataeniobius toweri TaxID=208326 RepID=A0ABU7A5Y9_9TELE|nr:hypothetical protein [Ataeniobius toweri]
MILSAQNDFVMILLRQLHILPSCRAATWWIGCGRMVFIYHQVLKELSDYHSMPDIQPQQDRSEQTLT